MSNDRVTPGDGIRDLPPEQAEGIGGGCYTGEDLKQLTDSFTQSYENLVDFVSHVIERVAGK